VSSRADEVEASVHAHVELFLSLRLLLLAHERFVLVVLCQLASAPSSLSPAFSFAPVFRQS
jgi:hypothetical protein